MRQQLFGSYRWNDLYAFNMMNAQCAHASNDTWQLRFLFTKNRRTDLYFLIHFWLSLFSLWFECSVFSWIWKDFFSSKQTDENISGYGEQNKTKQNRTIWIGTCVLVSLRIWSKEMLCLLQEENEIEVEFVRKYLWFICICTWDNASNPNVMVRTANGAFAGSMC